uniref:Uncharacterized protein n=1 Tax=Neospora caninum (strain Liverpool) TaxID=572307 RepID=A0A0F7UDB3_NEOCL|nr:TPA: hypothetical protein BN1204_028360 [Neospora caninum Liverpool]
MARRVGVPQVFRPPEASFSSRSRARSPRLSHSVSSLRFAAAAFPRNTHPGLLPTPPFSSSALTLSRSPSRPSRRTPLSANCSAASSSLLSRAPPSFPSPNRSSLPRCVFPSSSVCPSSFLFPSSPSSSGGRVSPRFYASAQPRARRDSPAKHKEEGEEEDCLFRGSDKDRESRRDLLLPLICGKRQIGESTWIETVKEIDGKREGRAAALWLNAIAKTASPLSVLLAATALQERKWLVGDGDEARPSTHANVKRPSKGKKDCVALQRIQETLLLSAHRVSDPVFVLILKLLFSSSFALDPNERALLVTQLDQRVASMHASLLPNVASALSQNLTSRNPSSSSPPSSSPSSPASSREEVVRQRVVDRLLPFLLSDPRDSLFRNLSSSSFGSPVSRPSAPDSLPATRGSSLSSNRERERIREDAETRALEEISRNPPQIAACIASCGKLRPLSVEQRTELKGLLKALVRAARDGRKEKAANASEGEASRTDGGRQAGRGEAGTHTSPQGSEEDGGEARTNGDATREAANAVEHNAWLQMTDVPGKEDRTTHRPSEMSASSPSRLGDRQGREATAEAAGSASESQASREREAQLVGEMLLVPSAMAAIGSADALLFFDCVDAIYKFLPRYSDAQLATFCRRAALVQFEKRDSENEESRRVNGFHLFTLFLVDRLPTMSPPRQEKLGAVLAAFVGNHPPHVAASLSLLASSFLIHMHPNVVRGTGNLWSGVDPLSSPSRRFSLAFSNSSYASRIVHISRTASLFLSPSTSLLAASAPPSAEAKKVLAALRVYRRSLERISQERGVLASLHAADLIKLLDATLRLKQVSSLSADGKAKQRPSDAAGDLADQEMLRVFNDILHALHKKAAAFTVSDAEALLGVLNLLGQRDGSAKKGAKPQTRVLSPPATTALLTRLLHIAATRPERRENPPASAALRAAQLFPELGDSVQSPAERTALDGEALLRARPLSFSQFLAETSRDRAGLEGLSEAQIKQLRLALQLLLPRPLEVFKASGLPDEVLVLLLFAVEATTWLVSEIGALPTFLSLSTAAPALGLSGRRVSSPRPHQDRDEGDGRDGGDDGDERAEEMQGREAAALMLFGITRQTLAGAFGACGLMLEEMQAKDRRRTQVVGLTSRLARLLPADIAASTDRRLLTESLLRALPADVEALRLACVELLGLRAIRRQETLFEKSQRRREERRQLGAARTETPQTEEESEREDSTQH